MIIMQKAYTVFVQNHFFKNNSGKLEPIWTKLYKKTCGRVARSPGNFGDLRLTAQNGAENKFGNFFSAIQRIVPPTYGGQFR